MPSAAPTALALFAAPAMLPWLAAAAVPVVIHLLTRRQPRRTPWGATGLLRAAVRKTARRVRLERWLLLAARTLAVAAVAAAVADPLGCGAGPLGGRTHHLLLIDDGLSARLRTGDGTALDAVRRAADRLMDSAPPGRSHAYSVLTMADPPTAELPEPSADRPAVAAALGRLAAGQTLPDPAAAWRAASGLLRGAEKSGAFDRQVVHVLTAGLRTTWPAEPRDAEPLRALLAPDPSAEDAPRPVRVEIVPVGPADPVPNVAVTALECDPLAEPDAGTTASATVRNTGATTVEGLRVRLTVRPEAAVAEPLSRPMTVRPGETVRVAFPLRFAAGGSHVLTASLTGTTDALPDDNSRSLALTVPRRVGVLLIDGKPARDPADRGTVFLRPALSAAAEGGEPLFAPTVISGDRPESRDPDLSGVSLVIAAGSEAPSPRLAAKLREWVAGVGGALLVIPGSRMSASDWNAAMGDVLPARLGREETAEADAAARLTVPASADGMPHPVAAPLVGSEAERSLRAAKTRRRLRLEIDPLRPGVQRILDFADGSPALVVADVGRGRVAVAATSLDGEWSDLAARPAAFVPLIRRLALHLIAPSLRDPLNRPVGAALDIPLSPAERGAGPRLERLTPTGPVAVPTEPTESGGLRVERLPAAGEYRLSFARPLPVRHFAATLDPAGSDLTRLDPADLRRTLGDGLPDDALTVASASAGPDEPKPDVPEPWGRWLLWAGLALLAAESALAGWFDRARETA